MGYHIYSPPVSYSVDFVNVSTVGLESSPVVAALAGLRANEARYFKNKYDHVFTVEPAAKAKKDIEMVHRILEEEREIVTSPPLEATTFQVENIRWTYVFYRAGYRSTSCIRSTDRIRSGRSGSSSPKGWTSPPSSASLSSRARSRSWQGPSEARIRDQGPVLSPYGVGSAGIQSEPTRAKDPVAITSVSLASGRSGAQVAGEQRI